MYWLAFFFLFCLALPSLLRGEKKPPAGRVVTNLDFVKKWFLEKDS